MRVTLAVTVETREGGCYFFDRADAVRHLVMWIEGGLSDRDDITDVTISDQTN